MKKVIYVGVLLCALTAKAQVGIGTATPNKSAELTINSGSRGLLIPQVSLQSTVDKETIQHGNVQSLLVYAKDTLGDVAPGYYYWDIDRWVRFATQPDLKEINIAGDVVGDMDNVKVVALQGIEISDLSPIANQVLVFDGAQWKPSLVKAKDIADGKNVTASSSKVILSDGAKGAVLKDFSIDVVEGEFKLQNIGGKVKNDQITPGSEGQLLITGADGSTKWVDQSEVVSETINGLKLVGNALISIVNGKESTVSLTDANIVSQKGIVGTGITVTGGANSTLENVNLSITPGSEGQLLITGADGSTKWVDQSEVVSETINGLKLVGNALTSIVNGKESTVSLTDANIVSQKGIVGTGITVTGGANSTLENVNLSITPGSEGQLLITGADGSTKWVDQSEVVSETINGLTLAGNALTSTVNGKESTVSLTDANIVSQKGIVGTGITVTGGANSTLENVNLSITPGSEGQLLITGADGSTKWVDQSEVVSETTNELVSTGNILTSTVSGEAKIANIINSIGNSITEGTSSLITSVNGVQSTIDLTQAIQAGQKTTTVVAGENATVTSVDIEKNTEYKVSVTKEDIQKNQLNTSIIAGNGLVVSKGDEAEMDGNEIIYNVAIDTNGATAGQVLTIEGEGDDKIVKWQTPIADNDTSIYSNDGTLVENRNVNMNGKSLNFNDGEAYIKFFKNKWGESESENSIEIKNDKRSTLKLTSGKHSFYMFQDPNSIGQISSAGEGAGIELASNTSEGSENSGIRFSLDRRLRMSLDKDDTFKVGILNYGSGELEEEVRPVGQYNSLNVVHGHVKIDEINEMVGDATDNIVVADKDGILKTIKGLKSTMPKFFYMPSVVMPTAADQISPKLTPNVTYNEGVYTVDLYANYVTQFGTPQVSSDEGFKLPVLPADELVFNITWFDSSVFEEVSVGKEGKLVYSISSTADVTMGSFMNIVFAVKP